MSDYSLQATWSTKDALATGQALKAISATELGAEFSAIATAVATKYDSDDLASQVQAEGLTLDTVLITPHSLNDVLVDNAGMLSHIQALADPNADVLLGWDDSAGAAIGFTLGDGIESSGTAIQLPATLAGDGLTLTSGVLAVVGGDGITANANDIAITDVAVTSSNPVGFTSGAPVFDASSLTAVEGSALAATDIFIVEDGGAPKQIAVQDMGFRVQTSQATQTLAANDMNSIMKFTATATLTIPTNASVDIPLGVPVVVIMDHATQELTVTADTGVTLESIFHPGGGSAASDTVRAGGLAVLVQTETDVWQISGDIKT